MKSRVIQHLAWWVTWRKFQESPIINSYSSTPSPMFMHIMLYGRNLFGEIFCNFLCVHDVSSLMTQIKCVSTSILTLRKWWVELTILREVKAVQMVKWVISHPERTFLQPHLLQLMPQQRKWILQLLSHVLVPESGKVKTKRRLESWWT